MKGNTGISGGVPEGNCGDVNQKQFILQELSEKFFLMDSEKGFLQGCPIPQ